MKLVSKIVLAHKGYFSAVSKKNYRENSVDVCRVSTTKDYIGMIELDIRKSKDGVLYCYHGSFFEYYFFLRFPKNFSYIKNKYNVDTLEEVLEVISNDKIIVLDIKDKSIIKKDILEAFQNKKFRDVVFGNSSVSFLESFGEVSKFMWGNLFCSFYNLSKLKQKNFKYFDVVFPWQINFKLVKAVELNGMMFGCFPLFFFGKKNYWNTINKYGLKRVNSDFV
jgi:hypothetical protein